MTDSYSHCVTSKADSSKERNPILQDYCSISEGERKLQFWFEKKKQTQVYVWCLQHEKKKHLICGAVNMCPYIRCFL